MKKERVPIRLVQSNVLKGKRSSGYPRKRRKDRVMSNVEKIKLEENWRDLVINRENVQEICLTVRS